MQTLLVIELEVASQSFAGGAGIVVLVQILSRARPDGHQPHFLHMPLHRFAIDRPPFAYHLLVDAPRPVERPGRVDFVDAPLDRYLLRRGQRGLVVKTGPRDREYLGLTTQINFPFQRNFPVRSLKKGEALTSAQRQDQIFR